MRRSIRILLGLLTALAASTMAEVVLLDEDFSAVTFQDGVLRDNTDWGINLAGSNWAITDGALTGTGQAAAGEAACGYVIPLAASGLTVENALTLSFDYATTNEGETVYVHIWGLKENATPSTPTTGIMSVGSSNGNVWDNTGDSFDLFNLGASNGEWTHSNIGYSTTAAAIVTGSGSYTHTFDIGSFIPAPNSLDQYDYIAIALTRNQANATGLTTFDNIRLTADTVAVAAAASIDPAALVMDMVAPATVATGTVDFVYNSDTTLDVIITFSEESHAGAFTVLPAPPLTFLDSSTELSFVIDNSAAGLASGETATGLVTFAWVETGGGANGAITMPISSTFGFPVGQTNLFVGAVSPDWGDIGNWERGRIPGALGADLALINNGSIVNVSGDFNGLHAWETLVRGGATLNIGSDWLGGGNLTVVGDAEVGFVNQTNGTASVATLTLGDSTATAGSNSVYTLSGGVVTTSGEFVIHPGGVMRVTGGTMTTATSIAQNGKGVAMAAGGVLEISGGTYKDTSRIWADSGSLIRVIGDDADITLHQLFGRYNGGIEFVLDETGVSTVKNDSWGQLHTTTFNIDGAAYVGGPQEILLYTGNWNNGPLGSNYAVTNMGLEGVDWDMIETTNTPHTVTLKILGSGYATWAAGYGLIGDDDAAEDTDYDGDNLNNLYEYALGGNPTNAADTGYAPIFSAVDIAGSDYFEYVYARRIDYVSNLVYTAEFGTDLVYVNWSTSDVVVSSETGIIEGDVKFETVTNRVDMTGKPVGFMQLLIESIESL